MIIIRKYRKLGWFDLLDRMTAELEVKPEKQTYFDLLDEIRMRKLESVSEGGSFKMKAPAKNLLLQFEVRLAEDSLFATAEDLSEFKSLIDSIL